MRGTANVQQCFNSTPGDNKLNNIIILLYYYDSESNRVIVIATYN